MNWLKKILTVSLLSGIILFIEVSNVDTSIITKERKISSFIKHNSSLTIKQADALADRFMSHGYDSAKWLAATAKVEADFMPNAVGSSGEVSMFQILNWPKGKDPTNIDVAIQEALKVRKEKRSRWGDTFEAIRAYNGSPFNPKTKYYANKVTKIMEHL